MTLSPQEILKKYAITAKKSLGQNFLVNDQVLDAIAHLGEVHQKNIVEVGPGYGALTEKIIALTPTSLTCVELDPDMIQILQERFVSTPLDIVAEDILSYSPSYESYSIIANIPYYITSPIIRRFLYDVPPPGEMILLMQDEVAQKILADRTSILSLIIAKKAYVHDGFFVSRDDFFPVPKVDSRVIRITPHSKWNHIPDKDFVELVQKGFSSPRKKLLKNLVAGGYEKHTIESIFGELSLSPDIRGEALRVEQWMELSSKLIFLYS